MTLPLVVLAALAMVAGGLNLPFGRGLLGDFLEPVLAHGHEPEVESATKWILAASAGVVALIGIVIARVWLRRTERPGLEPAVLKQAWGLDGLFSFVFGTGGRLVAASSAMFDSRVVDGAVNGVGSAIRSGGTQLRRLQTGYVRNYALGIAGGTVLVLAWVAYRSGVSG